MSAPTTDLEIRPGRNLWLLARTDRDGPSADTVALTAAAWMAKLWPATGGVAPPPSPLGPEGASRYHLGYARPLDVYASPARPELPPGLHRWQLSDLPPVYAIRAERPWWTLLDFDWRAPTYHFTEWPTRTVGTFGFASTEPSLEADWLLMDARHMGDASRPDGSLTADVVSVAKTTGAGLSIGLLALLAAYFWAQKR